MRALLRKPRPILASLSLSLSSALALAACGAPPPPRAEPRAPVDEWASLPASPEWLHVTRDFNGKRKAECEHVLGWIRGEAGCKATSCEPGEKLAAAWLERCTKIGGGEAAAEVKEVRGKMAERAEEPASPCGAEAEKILRDGCGADKTCEATAQRWATRCAASEGSPLAVRLLERAVERRLDEAARVTLDTRPCDELGRVIPVAARCDHKFKCEDALAQVALYRSRCEDGEASRPTLATAVLELMVIAGAEKPAEPIAARAGSAEVGAADVPVALADGSGAVVSVCGARALDPARFLEQRAACQAGTIVLARAFPGKSGPEVRLGTLEFPSDAAFNLRFPTLLAKGEREARDASALAAFEAALDKAARGATPAEAARLLARAISAHAGDLRQRAPFRAALGKRDASLVLAMRELGKAKLAALRAPKLPAADAVGLHERAQVRAFADLDPEGAVVIGAPSRALYVDTVDLLPASTSAYLEALKPASAGMRAKRLPAKVVAAAKARGVEQAGACGAALRRLQESKQSLVSCAFALEACDEARTADLARRLDEAIAGAEAAFREVTLARTGPAMEEALEIDAAVKASACREPWW